MQSQARVVVVGGGAVGVGVLYGLAKRGWRDVCLVEKTKLTAGSTWHAAGLIPSYARSHTVSRMINRSITIYSGLEKETGQNPGFHQCGQLRLARSRDRLDEYLSYMNVAEAQGSNARLLTAEECFKLFPLIEDRDVLGGLYHPDDGHIAPADVTMAMARGARDLGAKIHERTEVTGFRRRPGGGWTVLTSQGEIQTEHIVLATGNYARQTGQMLGLDLPCIPLIVQYWITEAVPEIRARKAAGLPEMPIVRDEAFTGFMREEGDSLMFGAYERPEDVELFAVNGVPKEFDGELFPAFFEGHAWNWEQGMRIAPVLGRLGIKTNIRGPMQMTSDELPLMGPAPGLDNVWLAEGVVGGILWGGGLGHHLAEWIVEGEPSFDMSELDPRRYGDYANKKWIMLKAIETWGTHADVHYPGMNLMAGRPTKTFPSYDRLKQKGAEFGCYNGWEMPNWYRPPGFTAISPDTYRQRNAPNAAVIAAEAKAVRDGVGLIELSPMAKFEVEGAGAAAALSRIFATRLPEVGRLALCYQLSTRGTIEAEYTVARLAEDRFYLVAVPRRERVNFDMLKKLIGDDASVRLANVTSSRGIFTIAGPKARELLSAVTEVALDSTAFPWLSVRTGDIELASDVRFLRNSLTGELAWELHHPVGVHNYLLDLLLHHGENLGLKLVGIAALASLRLDKSYPDIGFDMTREITALEAGLEHMIDFTRDFRGRTAVEQQKSYGLSQRLVTLSLDLGDADALGDEAIYRNGRMVGRITSAGWSWHFNKGLALALVSGENATPGTELTVNVLDAARRAMVIADSPYDPQHLRCRA